MIVVDSRARKLPSLEVNLCPPPTRACVYSSAGGAGVFWWRLKGVVLEGRGVNN